MDIKQQVAARRDEIARQGREAQAREKAADNATLDTVASALSDLDDAKIRREGSKLTIVPPDTLAHVIPATLQRSELTKLLKQESRKAWSPIENFLVLAPCYVGITTAIETTTWGWVLVIPAVIGGFIVNEKHREKLVQRYPRLFADVAHLKGFSLWLTK